MPFEIPSLEALKTRSRGALEAALPGVSAGRPGVAQALADALAGGVRGLFLQQAWLGRQLLPDTAGAAVMERWAALFGVVRHAAARASGQVRFTGTSGAALPQALVLQHASGQRYQTTAGGTLTGGTASLPVRAQVGGAAGNLAAGAALTLTSSVLGVATEAAVASGGLTGGAPSRVRWRM